MYFSYGLKIKGRKNLKELKGKGFISVSNHVQILDCVMCAMAIKGRKVTFTSIGSNFDMPFAGHLLKLLGVIPTPGTVYQTELFLKNCTRFINNKKIIHIYPEGHLVPYYNGLRDFNSGTFKIAYNNNTPILPLVFSWRKRKGIFRLWLPEKPCINLNIGKPIYPKEELSKFEQINYLKNETYNEMNQLYNENNSLIIENNNSLERMTKFEAQEMLISLVNELNKDKLLKLNQKNLKKAESGKLRKDKIIDLIYQINKLKQED